MLAKGVVNGALHCSKYTYKNLPSADSVTETFNNAYGTSVKYTKEVLSSVGNDLKSVNDVLPSTSSVSNLIPSVKTVKLAGLAAAYVAANGGFGVTNNSLMQPANSVGNHTLSSNLPLTYPNPTYQQIVQNKVDEATKKLTDANKWYEDKYVIPAEDSTNHKDASQSVMSRIFSVLRNPWNSLFNGAKKNDNNSESKWHKDSHKSEDLEKIIDGGILDNLFYPKVDNVINTSKRPGTFDSVELERLTREAPPSAYSNGLPRVL